MTGLAGLGLALVPSSASPPAARSRVWHGMQYWFTNGTIFSWNVGSSFTSAETGWVLSPNQSGVSGPDRSPAPVGVASVTTGVAAEASFASSPAHQPAAKLATVAAVTTIRAGRRTISASLRKVGGQRGRELGVGS